MYKFWEKNDPYFDWFKDSRETEENDAKESAECGKRHPVNWLNKLKLMWPNSLVSKSNIENGSQMGAVFL